jgi:hypothetical protein
MLFNRSTRRYKVWYLELKFIDVFNFQLAGDTAFLLNSELYRTDIRQEAPDLPPNLFALSYRSCLQSEYSWQV